MCSNWPPLRLLHIWIRRAKLSITLMRSFFGMARIFWLMATLSLVIDYALFSYTLSFKNCQRWKKNSGEGDSDGVNVEPPDQPIRKSKVEQFFNDVGCICSCPFLLDPSYISIHTMLSPKCPPELVHHINVMLLCDSDCFLVFVFKSQPPGYSMFSDGHPGRTFHRRQGPMKHLFWDFYSSVLTIIVIDIFMEPKVCFVASPNIRKSILFSNHWHIAKSFSISAGVSLCLIWICMGTAENPFLKFFATMKDYVLGKVFDGSFSDSFLQNCSMHSHCQEILLSTFFLIRDFLPFCWGCLLTLWLEMCVPNEKFGFSRGNC